MTDLFAFLAAVEEVHGDPMLPVPRLDRLISYSRGMLELEDCHQIETAAVSDAHLRRRLAEVWRIIRHLETDKRAYDQVSPVNSPFQFEIVQAWRRQTRQEGHVAKTGVVLVGRERELQDLREWIARVAEPVLFLTGPGGIGKTTLLRKISESENQTCFLKCGGLISAHDFYSSLASARKIEVGSNPLDDLVENMSGENWLLLLDKVDDLSFLGAALASLHDRLPMLKTLATSRNLTNVPIAKEYILAPLDAEADQDSAAVSLFVQVAQSFFDRFQSTATNLRHVRELCRLTKGVPLSISIAAGCLQTQDLPQIVDSLRHHVEQDGSVSATVGQSFRLLSDRDRQVLHQLCLFADRFGFEDAQIVTAVHDGEFSTRLAHLQRCALIQADVTNGVVEYRVQDSVQEYLDQLTELPPLPADHKLASDRYLELFAQRAEEIGELMREGHWRLGINQLTTFNGNLRQAMRRAVAEGDKLHTHRFADGLARTYFEAGFLSDFEFIATAGMALEDTSLSIRMLGLRGALASIRSDNQSCRQLWKRRLELARSIGDIASSADSLIDLAWQAFEEGSRAEAMSFLTEAEELSDRADIMELVATAQVIRSQMMIELDNHDDGRIWIERTVQTLEQCRDRSQLPFIYQGLARSYAALGENNDAIQALRKLLALAVEGRRAIHIARALGSLAPLYEKEGEVSTALKCYLCATYVLNEYQTKDFVRISRELNEFCSRQKIAPQDARPESVSETWEAFVQSLV